MKAYLVTTGLVFALIFVAHTLEMADRGRVFPEDALVLGVCAGLAGWAWRLVRVVR